MWPRCAKPGGFYRKAESEILLVSSILPLIGRFRHQTPGSRARIRVRAEGSPLSSLCSYTVHLEPNSGSPSLAGEDKGLPRSAPEVCAGLGTCCRPGSAVDHEVAPLNPPPASVPFGSSLSATLARSPMTIVAQVYMCLPYPLPSHRPAFGCQESRPPCGSRPARLRVPLYIVRAALYSGP